MFRESLHKGGDWALEAVPMGSSHGGQGGGTPRTEGTWDPIGDGQWGRVAPGEGTKKGPGLRL